MSIPIGTDVAGIIAVLDVGGRVRVSRVNRVRTKEAAIHAILACLLAAIDTMKIIGETTHPLQRGGYRHIYLRVDPCHVLR